MEKLLRRYENTLVIVGTGVIMYGIWSVAKSLFLILQDSSGIIGEFYTSLEERRMSPPEMFMVNVILYSMIGAVLAADIALRLYVGRSARDEGLGKKDKGYGYIVIAGLMTGMTLLSVVISAAGFRNGIVINDIEEFIITAIVELTSAITLIEMILSALKVKKLRKEKRMREETSAGADRTEAFGN